LNNFEALLARRSIPAQYLKAPGPNDEQIGAAIELALRAPDHGRHQPWRYRLIRGAARERFAKLLIEAALARDPATAPAQLEKLGGRPRQVPLIVVLSAQLRPDPKVPEIEQLLAAGAGAMNLLNAFHLQGFGAIWLTGPSAYDARLAASLGCLADERVLGFLYVGTIAPQVPALLKRVPPAALVSEWVG
jgi:nitroreductase